MKSFSSKKKTISRSVRACPQFSKKNINLSSILCFWAGVVLSLSHLVVRQLEIMFKDGSHWGHAHIHVFCHYSDDLFGLFLTVSLTVLISFYVRAIYFLPLLRRSSDVPSSLNLFTTWYTMYLAPFNSLIYSEFVLRAHWSQTISNVCSFLKSLMKIIIIFCLKIIR